MGLSLTRDIATAPFHCADSAVAVGGQRVKLCGDSVGMACTLGNLSIEERDGSQETQWSAAGWNAPEAQKTEHWASRTHNRRHTYRPHGRAGNGDPTQFAKGRTGDCPAPRKETKDGPTVTWGGGWRAAWYGGEGAWCHGWCLHACPAPVGAVAHSPGRAGCHNTAARPTPQRIPPSPAPPPVRDHLPISVSPPSGGQCKCLSKT